MDTPEDKPVESQSVEAKPLRWVQGDPLKNMTKPVIEVLTEVRKALLEQQKILMQKRVDIQKRGG